MTTGFEQAGIKIEKEAEFAALKQSIERLLSASLIEKFFKKLDKNNVRVREFEMVLSKRLLEQVDENLAKSGKSAQSLYEALSMTDKGQMREFYLTKIEEVNPEIRARFQNEASLAAQIRHGDVEHIPGLEAAARAIVDRVEPDGVVITLSAGDGNLVGTRVLEQIEQVQ